MEVKCYLKAKTEQKYEKSFKKNLPALFCLLLLTRQFDKAGVIPFFIFFIFQGGLLEILYPSELYFNVFPFGYSNPL